ncbi:hypothetical protein [Hyphococcus sp.]|uniref:hypothetical protein n=1 Tax=Hyphococcus sp. TaxID=2038636 RepID=UPI003CCC2603
MNESGAGAMAFGGKQNQAAFAISADRLSSLAGGVSAAQAVTASGGNVVAERPATLEPDLSRMRPRGIDETPEERKKRLAAKSVNFTATFIARLLIMGALGNFAYDVYQLTGTVHRGVAVGMFVMLADLGRVGLKVMEPGTK